MFYWIGADVWRSPNLFKCDWKYGSYKTRPLGTVMLCSAVSNQVYFVAMWMLSAVINNSPERGADQWLTGVSEQEHVFSLFVSHFVLVDKCWVHLHLQNTFKSSCCWWGVINPEQSLVWVCSLHPWKSCPKREASSHISLQVVHRSLRLHQWTPSLDGAQLQSWDTFLAATLLQPSTTNPGKIANLVDKCSSTHLQI